MDTNRLVALAHARLDTLFNKDAFVPADQMGGGGAPPGAPPGAPMDPAMMGMPPGMPMDPAMMGMPPGMPPGMDPAAMGGGAAPSVDPLMQIASKIDMLIGEIRGFMTAVGSGAGGGKSKGSTASAGASGAGASGGGDTQQIMQMLSGIASALGVGAGGQAGSSTSPSQFTQQLGAPGTMFPGGMPGSGMTVQASAPLTVTDAAERYKRVLHADRESK